jgi:L-malate glycosyltransferase
MKILLLTDVNSSHSRKWALGLADHGVSVGVFSISSPVEDWYSAAGISLFTPLKFKQGVFSSGLLQKIKYLRLESHLKKVIRAFNPDVVHAHYASSYGLLGALSRFHPLVISVWGSDVFNFPKQSVLHRALLKFNLKKGDRLLSTSRVMARETERYTQKEILVTPFGIDTSRFKPETGVRPAINETVIGTIKTLEEKYGVAFLIRAFSLLFHKYPDQNLKLLIVGSGSLEKELKELAATLGIDAVTEFTGSVPFGEIVGYHNRLDIYVAVSTDPSESFGVAVLEASACGKPVVVSNIGGLPEVVRDGITGFVVPPRNAEMTAEAVEKLVCDPVLRKTMGERGRSHVKECYEWNACLQQMTGIYTDLILQFKNLKNR